MTEYGGTPPLIVTPSTAQPVSQMVCVGETEIASTVVPSIVMTQSELAITHVASQPPVLNQLHLLNRSSKLKG